jgi:Fe-S-cluster containining protein
MQQSVSKARKRTRSPVKDNAFRKAVKSLARWRYLVDLKFTRLYRKPLYRLVGSCTRCGACCRNPSITVLPVFLYLRSTRSVLIAWHRIVNGFELEHLNRRTGLMVFRCAHFEPETGLCDSYKSRPGICRDYPLNLLDAPSPEFLETCGFRAVLRNAESLTRALEDAGVAPDTLADLKKKMNLE